MSELADNNKPPVDGRGAETKPPGDKVDPHVSQQQNGQPNTKPEATKPVTADAPADPKPAGSAIETHVSQQQLGQPEALKIVKETGKPANGAAGLNSVELVDKGQTKPEERLTRKQLEKIADTIDQAANGGFFLGIGTDKVAINEQLKRIKHPQDREILDQIYRKKVGIGIEDELRDELSGSDLDKALALWKPTNIDAARVSVALTEHKEWGWGARSNATVERDLRDTVSTLNSKQIEDMDQAYRKEHKGVSIRDALLEDPNLPEATKQALDIYLKGSENRTTADTLKLADIALKERNLDMFEEGFRDASPEARKAFLEKGGQDRILQTFGKPVSTGDEYNAGETVYVANDDSKQALDYVKKGKLGVATKIESNTGIINDNEEGIELTLEKMTDDERRSYGNGKLLAKSPVEGLTEEQKNDRAFYDSVHKALLAAGNEREMCKWEDMITCKDGTLVTQLSKHGGIIDDSMGEVLRTIEDMPEEDWKRLKENPDQLKRIQEVLAIDLSDAEMTRANALLARKMDAPNYLESKSVQRSVEESIGDEVGFWNTNESGVLDAIARMTKTEQEQYRNDPEFRKKINALVVDGMDEGNEQNSAFARLDAITRGEKPEDDILSKLYVHADHFNTDEAMVIQDLEQAFKKDPKLRERLATDSEYRKKFNDALHGPDGALDPDEYERYARPIVDGDRLSMKVKAELYKGFFNDDEKGLYETIKLGSAEDFKEIIADPEGVLPFLSADERQVAVIIASQNGEMRPEDKIRAAMLGAGTDEQTIHETLKDLKPADIEKVRAEYLRKYDSDILGDMLEEMGGSDRDKVIEKAGAQPETSREAFNNARDGVYKTVDGTGRAFVNCLDGTGAMTMDELNQYATGMSKYASRFEDMPLEQRTAFKSDLLKAKELYAKSENSAADMVVDGAIIAAGVLGAKFTGGVSLSLLAYTSFGGALFKIGAKAAIVGNDYDFASADVITDGATGAIDATTIFLGPAQAAQFLKLGGKSAETAAATILAQSEDLLQATGKQILKQGSEGKLQERIFEEVAVAISQGAEGVDRKAIVRVAEEFAATPEDVAKLSGMVEESLSKAVALEGANALKAQMRELALNSLAGNVGGGSSGVVYGFKDLDESRSLNSNFYQIAQSGFTGAMFGTGMAAGFTLGIKSIGKGLNAFSHVETPHAPHSTPEQILDNAIATAGSATVIGEGGNRIVGQVAEAFDDVAVNGGASTVPRTTPSLHEGNGGAGRDAVVGETGAATHERSVGAARDEVAGDGQKPEGGNPTRTESSTTQKDGSPPIAGAENGEQPRKFFQAGDEVVFKGEQGTVLGFDGNTGDAIIHYPARKDYATQMRPFDKANTTYTPIEVNGQPYYRDEHGIVYGTMDIGNGPKIYVKHEYRVAPSESLTAATGKKGQVHLFGEGETPAAKDGTAPGDLRKPKEDIPVLRVEAPEIPRIHDRTGPRTFHESELYNGATLTLDGKPLGKGLSHDGPAIEVGRGSLGLDFTGAHQKVSSKHASIKWDETQQMYYLEEHSTNGTYLKRSGEDNFTHLPGGKEKPYKVYLGPNDTIRLGSEEGPEINLNVPQGQHLKPPPGPKGDVDVRVFFDGEPLHVNADGELIIGRKHQSFGNESPGDILNRRVANEHAKLKWNESAKQWELTDLTKSQDSPEKAFATIMLREDGNGTFIKRENGQVDFVRGRTTLIGPNDTVHLGSPDGPELKFITNQGERQADGRVIVPRKNLDTAVKRPDGTTEISNFLNFKRLEDPYGRPIQTLNPEGVRTGFTYSEDNKLATIKFDDNSVASKGQDGKWLRTTSDGKSEPFWDGNIEVEKDGSIRFTDNGKPPTATIERVDGVREVVHPSGRVEYQNVHFDQELGSMNQIANSFEKPEQRVRFKQMMNDFETRAKSAGLSKEEQAQTFFQVRRLVTAEYGAFLTSPERTKLAEQIFALASDPTICQGYNNTCNVSTVEQRMFARKPSEAARLISDVVITGKYVTADGVVVDLGRIPGVLKPDTESSRLAASFAADGSDLRIDGKRPYASQIFEATAVNLKWNRSNEFKLKPGEIVVYEKPGGPVTSKTGEELVKYSVDYNGFLKREVLQGSPHIRANELTDIYNQIAGTADKNFVIYHSNVHGSFRDGSYGVTNAQQMQQALEKLQKDGGGPAILVVHTRNEPFWTDSGGGRAGGSGGWHVVNVQGVRRDAKTGQMVADVTNQWGTRANHTGDKAIPIETLFQSTMEPAAAAKPEKKGFLRRLIGEANDEPAPENGGRRRVAEAPPPEESAPVARTADGAENGTTSDVYRTGDSGVEGRTLGTDQIVGDRDPKGGLWSPGRHFDQLSEDDRSVLFELLHGRESPLTDPEFTHDFAQRALPEFASWTENYKPLYKQMKEYQDIITENREQFHELMEQTPGLDHTNLDQKREIMNEYYKDDHRKLQVINSFLDARDKNFAMHQRLDEALEPRRQQIQDLANSVVAGYKTADGSLVGIPNVKVELVSPEHMGSAVATYGDGVLRINKAELLNNKSVADLLGTVYHELTHNEQQTTIVRALADELKIGTRASADEMTNLRTLYRERTGSNLPDGYARRVLELRNGVELPENAVNRAKDLMEAFKLNRPVGTEWVELGNSFRRIQRELPRLEGRVEEKSVAARILSSLSDSRERELLSMRYFGTKEVPPELNKYIQGLRRYMNGNDNTWNNSIELEARQAILKLMRENIDSINNRRRDLYEHYMQFHEYDAWLSGERLRRSAIANGATFRDPKNSLWEEIDWLQ